MRRTVDAPNRQLRLQEAVGERVCREPLDLAAPRLRGRPSRRRTCARDGDHAAARTRQRLADAAADEAAAAEDGDPRWCGGCGGSTERSEHGEVGGSVWRRQRERGGDDGRNRRDTARRWGAWGEQTIKRLVLSCRVFTARARPASVSSARASPPRAPPPASPVCLSASLVVSRRRRRTRRRRRRPLQAVERWPRHRHSHRHSHRRSGH